MNQYLTDAQLLQMLGRLMTTFVWFHNKRKKLSKEFKYKISSYHMRHRMDFYRLHKSKLVVHLIVRIRIIYSVFFRGYLQWQMNCKLNWSIPWTITVSIAFSTAFNGWISVVILFCDDIRIIKSYWSRLKCGR